MVKRLRDRFLRLGFGRRSSRHKPVDMKLRKLIVISCACTAAATYIVLSGVSAEAKKIAASRSLSPEYKYLEYLSEGYSFEIATQKKNILLSVADGEDLCRASLFTFDLDKHTLDILEIPSDTLLSCGGFSGTLAEAFRTDVYREIVTAALLLHIDGMMCADTDTVSDCATLLGGVKFSIPNEITISGYTISKGERLIVGSLAGIIFSDGEAYSEGDIDRVSAYRYLFCSFISALKEKGAVEWVTALLEVMVNRVDTDMNVSQLIELVNLFNSVSLSKMNLWILDGQPCLYSDYGYTAFAVDASLASEVLNSHFRVKDSEMSGDSLGFASASTAAVGIYKDLKTSIIEILK